MLDLKEFSKINSERSDKGFNCANLPLTYWATALTGELGKLCNMIKKKERVRYGGLDGGSSYTAADITTEMLEEEIGGIFIYLDLLAQELNISLEEAVIKTFNAKSKKLGLKHYIAV